MKRIFTRIAIVAISYLAVLVDIPALDRCCDFCPAFIPDEITGLIFWFIVLSMPFVFYATSQNLSAPSWWKGIPPAFIIAISAPLVVLFFCFVICYWTFGP
jgi:hypothetical protein